jgi:hypothetical protein
MKAFPKVGLLALVALLAAAAMATSAQAALTINPAGVLVHGQATNPTLTYGVATVTCNTGTADGSTSNPASDRITDLALTFTGNCAVAGVGAATVTCQGFVTVIARNNISATNNPGVARLNAADEPALGDPVFKCDVTTALCTITVQGAQNTTPDPNLNLNETTHVLAANVNVNATRVGSVACGPASGSANFTANYATSTTDPDTGDPAADLTIDGTP